MDADSFKNWVFDQPELIQVLVMFGPPAVVAIGIWRIFGLPLRRTPRTWPALICNPPHMMGVDKLAMMDGDDDEADWTDTAHEQVDELIARRRARR